MNISFSLHDVTVGYAFSEIERKTHYTFAFDNTEIDLSRTVSVKVENSTVEKILELLFKNTDVFYKVSGNHILLAVISKHNEDDSKPAVFPVTGLVLSSNDKMPIPGVTIIEEGTQNGTISDDKGYFTLTAISGKSTIQFSAIGFVTRTITVNAQSVLHVELEEHYEALEQVVVIGYGKRKKVDLTSSIASISSREINKSPVATLQQSMQGLSPGIEVVSNRGGPGEGAIISVRGIGSINNTNPLFVLDGVPIVETSFDFEKPYVSSINTVNPLDIESVEILKDAAACAIYGTRGANGVIMVTTKKGEAGKTTVRYDGYYGLQTVQKEIDLLNARQYAILNNEINQNAITSGIEGARLIPISADPDNMPYDTDWQDEIFRTAPIQNHSISVSGGKGNHLFYFSGNYYNQQGIILATGYKKYNIRLNSEIKTKRFKFGESVGFTRSYKANEKKFHGNSLLIDAIRQTPGLAIYDENAIGGYAGTTVELHAQDYGNPVGAANLLEDDQNANSLLANFYGQFEIIKGLSYKLNLGIDYIGVKNTRYAYKYAMGDYNINLDADLAIYQHERITSLIENNLSYIKTLGKNNLVVLLGYTEQYSRRDFFSAANSGFPNDEIRSLDAGSQDKETLGNWSEFAIRSFLGRMNYSFAGKYLLTANIRKDGSSKFSKKHRWSTFPSISAAWIVTKENFFHAGPVINILKIRGSYGIIGNQAIGDYQYETGLNYYAGYIFGPDQAKVPGTIPSYFGNEEIKWETTKQMDIGFDLHMFNYRLQVTADYYVKNTEDMLIQEPIPFTTGNANPPPFTNAGSLKSQGIEVSGIYNRRNKNFNYSIGFHLATSKNEITKLGTIGAPVWGGNFDGSFITRTAEGYPVAQFYGYITDGIYNSEEEINAMNKYIDDENGNRVFNQFAPNAEPGDIRFKDLNGDGLLTEEDRDYLGTPFPDFTSGLNLYVKYKGFDFYLHIYGVYGNEIFMATTKWLEGIHSNSNAGVSALDYWTPTNTNTNIPRPIAGDPNNNLAISDRYIKDGSYARLKNIVIGYSLNSKFLNRLNISNLRFYIQGQNLLTFTKYPGWDPEIGSYGFGQGERGLDRANLSKGIDNGYYPQSRTILTGIQIRF
ncbi:MAG: TonB-dependent receptor [Bacteroidales bacterium]|nr:TonB-dependent receptor [Bacteroidales bacterium]